MSHTAVTAVERALDVFEAFDKVRKPLSLTDLADMTGVPKSSCHAIVGTLIARGYLYSLVRPRSLYPTRRLFDLARSIHEKDPFVESVVPMLEHLRDTSRETVILGKRQGNAVLYLQVIESFNPIRYSANPGEYKPLHSSSIGKALLGGLKEHELRSLLADLPLPEVTGTTLTQEDALLADLRDSRRRGYFLTRGENVPDVWAVSAPISFGSEVLAIAVAGPRHRMEDRVEEHARLLAATCSSISRQSSRA